MKQKQLELSRRYGTALRKHLTYGSPASLQSALKLGREAVVLELETLAMVRIHKSALALSKKNCQKEGMARRAEAFFIKATAPIVCANSASNNTLNRLNDLVNRRSVELSTANCQLQRRVVLRQRAGKYLQKTGQHKGECLKESLLLQKRLQQLAHRVLAAQEDERKKISHELQNEIAQILLGINVRLLILKQRAQKDPAGLKNEIASLRRLMVNSTYFVREFAQKLGNFRPTQ